MAHVRQRADTGNVFFQILHRQRPLQPGERTAEGEQECLGFTLRPTPAAPKAPLPPSDELVHGLAELSGQIGRVPLADLLAELGHLAEKHIVESALARAGGRTQVAAEMLGVTVESLQLRLRRHGLSAYVYSGPDGPPQSIN